MWREWEASLPQGERTPDLLQMEKFLEGLLPSLREKVKGKITKTFQEALQWARQKDRKLQFQSQLLKPHQPLVSQVTLPNESAPIPQPSTKDPHLEMLQRVTNQLDNLSINLVQGPRVQVMEDQNWPQQRR